jgi:hypothetical protein
VAADGERQVDRDKLAVRVSRGLAEDDPLAGHGVLDHLACVCHFSASFV